MVIDLVNWELRVRRKFGYGMGVLGGLNFFLYYFSMGVIICVGVWCVELIYGYISEEV